MTAHQQQLNNASEYTQATGITMDILRDAVLSTWNDIEQASIAGVRLLDVADSGVVSNLFHSLLPIKLSPLGYRKDQDKNEKDLHYIADPKYSLEIKTSTSNRISGSVSYIASNKGTKERSSLYLCIFWSKEGISSVKFGVINFEDWNLPKAGSSSAAIHAKAEIIKNMIEIGAE